MYWPYTTGDWNIYCRNASALFMMRLICIYFLFFRPIPARPPSLCSSFYMPISERLRQKTYSIFKKISAIDRKNESRRNKIKFQARCQDGYFYFMQKEKVWLLKNIFWYCFYALTRYNYSILISHTYTHLCRLNTKLAHHPYNTLKSANANIFWGLLVYLLFRTPQKTIEHL